MTDPPGRSSPPSVAGSGPGGEQPARLRSLDVLRGLTILVMIFVNDLAGVRGTPGWMKHVEPSTADGMTFVDVVFPAFLFIVGMSIPFAIGRRLERGEPAGPVWRHVLTRTLALLLIGVFMVNGETISAAGPLPPALWSLLVYAGVILVWGACPVESARGRAWARAARAAGALLLVAMALAYRGGGEPGFIELRPQWWGILGLIGWAYLVACASFILLRRNLAGMVGMVALLYCVFIAGAAGGFSRLAWITRWVDIGSMLGSQAALTLSGAVLGVILVPGSPVRRPGARLRWGLLYGVGLAAAAYLLHAAHRIDPMFIINKNAATPPWCLWSAAFTTWGWVAVYWLVDLRQWQRWTAVVEPAGQNPLLAYLLAPLLYAAITLLTAALALPAFYDALGSRFATGFWRALFFALGVSWLAGRALRWGFRLQL
jgi:predicted acyltransferase